MKLKEEMIVFSKEWFLKHQKGLLLFANTFFGKWLLRIHKDCPKGKRIVNLLPNCYTWDNEDGTRSTDFRTHNKFAKRLYYSLKPLWYTLHFWDWLVADRWQPELSFGFDTLTFYPAAGANSPCDGYIDANETANFAAVRNATNGQSSDVTASSAAMWSYKNSAASIYIIRRGFFLFDTSSLSDSAPIDSGVLSLFGTNKFNAHGVSDTNGATCLVSATPASTSNLVTEDYDQVGSTELASRIGYSAFSTTGYNNMILNAAGLSNINKTGITKFGVRGGFDLDNVEPTFTIHSSGTYHAGYFADITGVVYDPKLVVTYFNVYVPIPIQTSQFSIPTIGISAGLAQYTVSNGQIELAAPAKNVEIGLPYTTTMTDLPVEIQTPVGTTQGQKVSVNRITVRLHESLGGEIEGQPLLPNSGIAQSGDKMVQSLGWDNQGVVTIEQKKPLPLTVLAIIKEVTVNG